MEHKYQISSIVATFLVTLVLFPYPCETVYPGPGKPVHSGQHENAKEEIPNDLLLSNSFLISIWEVQPNYQSS